jgi:hypothetical protein
VFAVLPVQLVERVTLARLVPGVFAELPVSQGMLVELEPVGRVDRAVYAVCAACVA